LQDGIIVPVFDRLRLEYSYLTNSISETVRLARDINVAPFYRVQLIIRVHALAISGTQSFAFVLTNTLPSDVDPREFSEAGTPFMTVTVAGGTPPSPPVIVRGTATDPGAFLKLAVTATQSTTGTTLYGEFSGTLVLRRA